MEFLKGWHDYFIANSSKQGEMFWSEEVELTEEEKGCIAKSIAAFQLGEYSEGKGLLKSAESFARKTDHEYLVRITKLFILEEQNHAMLLKKFMDIHGIKQMKRNWTDAVFRRLRKSVGFELSITVLITAEIIALVYYRALKACTGSRQLKAICDKILADEFSHVRYESGLINYIRDQKPGIYKLMMRFLHAVLFLGTTGVVYLSHRKVIRKGGYDFGEFWDACWVEFANCFYPKRLAQVSVGG